MLEQIELFTEPKHITRGIILTIEYIPVSEAAELLASYRCRRSNAFWFATQNDGYSLVHPTYTIDIPKGNSVKCSKMYYQQCVDLSKQLGALDAKPSHIGTDESLSAPDVDSRNAVKCLCLDCLRAELTILFAARQDGAEMFFGKDDATG